MAYSYVRIDGQRVEVSVAEAFGRMREAFETEFGLDLLVTSGTRTAIEQKRLRDAYLAGVGGLAAPVGRSNHEEGGPRGPRALDLRDSGRTAGVTRSGSARAKWLRANAPRFGFDPAGYRFSQVEPWHYEFTGKIGVPPVAPKPSTSGSSGAPITETSREDEMIVNIKGKAGARRGGLYYIAGGVATFLGAHAGKGFPTLTDEAEIRNLQKRVSGIG